MKKSAFYLSKLVIGFALICFILFISVQDAAAQKSAMEMVKDAKKDIENLSIQQAKEEMADPGVVLIDIRESEELRQGKIPGAVHAPRGMLEFYADSTLPYHKPEFSKNKRIVLYCATSGRSALAVQTLKAMGFTNVAHIDGGFKAWKEAGLPVDQKDK